MTDITMIRTLIPSTTPRIEIKVISDKKVRFGFRYRNARKQTNGSRIFFGIALSRGIKARLSVKESTIELQPRHDDNVANCHFDRFPFLFDQRLGEVKCDSPQ